MKIAFRTDNLFQAHLAKHALEDAGIPAFVMGESLLGAGGELPLFGLLRVGVPEAALAQALSALQEAGVTDAQGREVLADPEDLDSDWEDDIDGVGTRPA